MLDRRAWGYLAAFSAPTFVRDDKGKLAVGWMQTGDDWAATPIIVGSSFITGLSRGAAAIARYAASTPEHRCGPRGLSPLRQ